MKSAEEIFKSYIKSVGADGFHPKNIANTLKNAFFSGARFEREELTQWNNPDDLLPQDGKDVLIKIHNPRAHAVFYAVGCVFGNEWDVDADTELALLNPENKIIGWREIHE